MGAGRGWVVAVVLLLGGLVLGFCVGMPEHSSVEPVSVQSDSGVDSEDDSPGAFSRVAGGGAASRRVAEPVVPLGADEGPILTEVRVEDRWGKPVAGVRIVGWSKSEVLELGETDEAGRLEARLGGVLGVEGQRSGYARARRRIGQEPPEVLWLRLQPGRSLEGRVLLRGSGTPVEGVRVLAHLKGLAPEPHSVLRAREGSPLGISGVSGADGVFRLEGMDIDLDYQLAAGGRGYVLWERSLVPAGDRMAPQLEVGRLFGVRVVWADPVAGAVACSPRLWGVGGADTLSDGALGITSVSEIWASTNLAGGFLRDPALPFRPSPNEWLFLYACSSDAERLGPISVSMTLPGYARGRDRVWATPVEDEISEHVIELERTAEAFGSLTIEFEGWKGLSSSTTFESPRVMLQVQHSDSEKEISTILDLEESVDAIGAIPTGEVVFSISKSQNRWPIFEDDAPRYQLEEGENRIPIDISEWGGIEMEFTDAHGPILGGPATFVLDLTSGPAADESLRFRGAPYRYFGLDPGTYTLTAQPNEMIGRESMTIEGIEVQAGEMTRVQFPVGP